MGLPVGHRFHQGRRASKIPVVLGIFIQSTDPFPIGTMLDLRFNTDDEGDPLHIAGEVVWINPLTLGEPADRFHVVVEVEDIEDARHRIKIEAPPSQAVSWGAHLFQVRDPDGIPITFLQWAKTGGESS